MKGFEQYSNGKLVALNASRLAAIPFEWQPEKRLSGAQ